MGFVNAKLDVNKDENVYYKMQDIYHTSVLIT